VFFYPEYDGKLVENILNSFRESLQARVLPLMGGAPMKESRRWSTCPEEKSFGTTLLAPSHEALA
jgi:hypothetical protein